MCSRHLIVAILLTALSIPAIAQQPGCSPPQPTASLDVNGTVPGPGTNDVSVYGATGVYFAVTSTNAPYRPVVFVAGNFYPNAIPCPWGGSVDLSAPQVIADGYSFSTGSMFDYLAFTPFVIGASVPAAISQNGGILGAVQAIVVDPTNPPFQLRTSIAARVTTGRKETVYTMDDDSFVQHTLGTATPIEFMGNMYTSFFIASNGYVTFNAGASALSSSMFAFFNGIGTSGNPAACVAFGDLNPNGVGGGSTYAVVETPTTVTVEFRNQVHFTSGAPAGNFGCTFFFDGYSDVRMNLGGYLAGTSTSDDVIVGISDGNSSIGIDTDLTNGFGTGLVNVIGSYGSPVSAVTDSIGEYIPGGVSTGITSFLFFELGAASQNTCRFAILP